jgi:hypothetical protein
MVNLRPLLGGLAYGVPENGADRDLVLAFSVAGNSLRPRILGVPLLLLDSCSNDLSAIGEPPWLTGLIEVQRLGPELVAISRSRGNVNAPAPDRPEAPRARLVLQVSLAVGCANADALPLNALTRSISARLMPVSSAISRHQNALGSTKGRIRSGLYAR